MGDTPVRSGRKIYIDFIRIPAIFMVLFNHTGKSGFVLFTVRQQSPFYPFYLFNAIFIKIAVPLFFMASGALLLGKNESYRNVIKRFLKFFLVLLTASFVSYLYECFYLHGMTFSLVDFFIRAYKKPISVALWYLYAYLAYILMLPLLRLLAQNMGRKAFLWLFAMYGLFRLLPIWEYIIWQGAVTHNSDFSFFITTNYVIFPLIGYYIAHRIQESELNIKMLLFLTISSVVSIILCSIMTHWKLTLTGNWDEASSRTFFNTLIFIPSGTAFYAARYFFTKHTPSLKTSRIISTIGGATFGLYLLEKICRNAAKPVFLFLKHNLPTLLACWIWILAACTLGILITLVLKKLPLLNKVL